MVSSHNVEFLPDIVEEYRVLLSQLVSIGYNLLCKLNLDYTHRAQEGHDGAI